MKSGITVRGRQRGAAPTWVFACFALIALFFLLTEHRAHLYGWLPYLFLAACPLMHFFHGHDSHAGHGSHADRDPGRTDAAPQPPAQLDSATPGTAAHQPHST